MKTTAKDRAEVVARLVQLGISIQDAEALRRCATTLRNWFEMECGTEINGRSVSIEREGGTDDGKPIQRVQFGANGQWIDRSYPIRDRETSARKKLAAVLKGYRALLAYVQGDCRGAAIYILRKRDVREGESVDSIYNRGVAVY